VEQCPLSPFRLTFIVTRTNSSFATAGTLCDIRALPEALADVLGAMDHERPSAVSVPVTAACGFVDTLMTTMLYGLRRFKTVAQHDMVEAAPDGETVRVAMTNVETAMALSTRATCATGHRNKAFTVLIVPAKEAVRYASEAMGAKPLFTREIVSFVFFGDLRGPVTE
jgi:hypothetical protein